MNPLDMIRTGEQLDAMDFPPLTAADLLAEDACSPRCLLARGRDSACTCPCNGEFHGVLLGVTVPVPQGRP